MPQLPARSRLLWRFLSSRADDHGIIGMSRALALSVELDGQYGPRDVDALILSSLVERHNGGWRLNVNALTGEVYDHDDLAV